jgi:hypothetical protein
MGLFHPIGTPRVLPSEYNTGPIGTRFQAHAPSSLSTSQGFHPVTTTRPHIKTTPAELPTQDHSYDRLLVSCETGFPPRLGPTLKLFSRSGASRFANNFTCRRQDNSPGLPVFRAFSRAIPGFPSPHEFSTSPGPEYDASHFSPCGERALLTFQPSGSELIL